ncbi:MAG: hypothetical protein ACTSWY_10410 [Promethearchaeota archaeon]
MLLINDKDYKVFGKINDIFLEEGDKIILISSIHGC